MFCVACMIEDMIVGEVEDMFYVLVSGKRDFTDYKRFCRAMDESLADISDEIEIVEGGAKGTDALARCYAMERGFALKEMKAFWNIKGRAAGPIRNSEMVKFVSGHDCKAVFFWDGKSKGTGDCLKKARKAGIPCEVHAI